MGLVRCAGLSGWGTRIGQPHTSAQGRPGGGRVPAGQTDDLLRCYGIRLAGFPPAGPRVAVRVAEHRTFDGRPLYPFAGEKPRQDHADGPFKVVTART